MSQKKDEKGLFGRSLRPGGFDQLFAPWSQDPGFLVRRKGGIRMVIYKDGYKDG